MASWSAIEGEVPELSARARGFLDAFVHKTLATLRRDGSPRISGSEVIFAEGELWLGSMWRSMKALDLLRDPRFALHSGSPDPDDDWHGDAKLAGRAEEIVDEELRERIFGGKGGPGAAVADESSGGGQGRVRFRFVVACVTSCCRDCYIRMTSRVLRSG